jgi:hypothetical protein
MKKSISMVWEGIFIASLASCHVYQDISDQAEYEKYKNRSHVFVLNVQTPGESHFFSEKLPGKMKEEEVTGIHQVLLQHFDADSLVYKRTRYKSSVDHVYKNGKKYPILEQDGMRFICDSMQIVHIPYSEIKQLRLKVYRQGNTVLLLGGMTGGLAGIAIWMLSSITYAGLGGI